MVDRIWWFKLWLNAVKKIIYSFASTCSNGSYVCAILGTPPALYHAEVNHED
jgi:hypothetical protein